MLSKFLFIVISQFSFFDNISEPEIQIKDGLILSYMLKNDGIIKIHGYLLAQGFEVYDSLDNNKCLIFFKYLDDKKREALSIIIYDGKAVSITHVNFDKGSEFADAVRSKLTTSDYFQEGVNKDEFLFCLPKKGIHSSSENSDCQYQSKILFNDVVIIFLIPTVTTDDVDWITKIQELTL